MKMKDMEGKRWEELCLIAFKTIAKREKQIDEAIRKLEDLSFCSEIDEIEEYLESINNKIHIPVWNKYPDTNPEALKICVEKYYVFMEPDFIMEAKWENGNFYTENECHESGKLWDVTPDITFWLPINYPTPY